MSANSDFGTFGRYKEFPLDKMTLRTNYFPAPSAIKEPVRGHWKPQQSLCGSAKRKDGAGPFNRRCAFGANV
jgi:hypothetical protein